MRRILAVLAGLVMATTGCIKLEQTLTINKDGSAALDVSYGMSEATIQQMQQMSQMGQQGGESKSDDNDFEFDEAKVKSKLSKLEKEGVVVKSVSTSVKEGWKYMNIKLEAKSLAALKKTEFVDEMSLSKDAKGNYVLQMNDKKDKADGEEMNDQMMAQMGPMFAGFRAVMKVKVPGKIIETDAGAKTDDTATWTYDMEKDPKALMKAEKDLAKIVFAAPGVTLPVLKGGKEDIEK